MPIKGVSEVIRLPRQGKIKLGVKEEGDDGNPYPVPTDYFVCPDEVKKVFGDKPKALRIMFPTDDETQWASQYLRCYSETGDLLCRGDGETALARVETVKDETGSESETVYRLLEMPCNPDRCPLYQKGFCRRVMNLQFLLPECPGFGVYQLDTSSYYSIININSSLKLIRGVCGRLAMIPLSLELIKQHALIEGIRKPIWVLSLTASQSLADIQRYAQIPPDKILLLPAPDNEAPDDMFPPETLERSKPEKEMIELWTRAKSRVWQLDVRDQQVADWFRRNYQMDVRLSDFDLLAPPPQITTESLEHFIRALERHAEHI